MAKFELTARNDMLYNGMHVAKGQTIELSIPVSGITPNNLFNNSRCIQSVLHQFEKEEYKLTPNSPLLSPSKWDIKMK